MFLTGIVCTIITWIIAIHQYFRKMSAYTQLYGEADFQTSMVFMVSAMLFGTFVNFLHLELTQLYIKDRILAHSCQDGGMAWAGYEAFTGDWLLFTYSVV